jgi:hypothetical protein
VVGRVRSMSLSSNQAGLFALTPLGMVALVKPLEERGCGGL